MTRLGLPCRVMGRVVGLAMGLLVPLCLATGTPSPALAQAPAGETCTIPDSVLSIDAVLPRVREALRDGGALNVLVVRTAKPQSERAPLTYPARMEAELKRRMPGREVRVSVRNLPDDSAEEMVHELKAALASGPPSLVVWQVGTVDAMRNLDVESFGAALAEGIELVHELGSDIIVMDMQYSLQTTQLINFQPYVDYIDWVTQNHDVFHFPRYDIMRHWVEDGQVDFNTETPEAKQRSFTFVHKCLGKLLADSILSMTLDPEMVKP
jgi:acyl-CoA thioesterase I